MGADTDEEDVCPICMMGISESVVVLQCGHKLHGQCAADYFRYGDQRCPTCRHNPYEQRQEPCPNADEPEPGLVFAPPRVSYHDALRFAMNNRSDKATKRMRTTLRTWKTTCRDASNDYKQKRHALKMREDAVVAKIDEFKNHVWSIFKKKNKNVIEAAEAARRLSMKASTNVSKCNMRLAKKYGYTASSRKSRKSRKWRAR